jgi:hypothetical protein
MSTTLFTPAELEAIEKYFGARWSDLDLENFKAIRNKLRAKYHPDKFEKFDDETVKEMAKERFQEIERLCEKMMNVLENNDLAGLSQSTSSDSFLHPEAKYGYEGMQIDIRTGDKDMKYHLFGTQYRWIEMGEKFKIPGTNAFVIAEANYTGRAVGYIETVRIYLSFGRSDSLDVIIDWLYFKIAGRALSLVIEGNVVKIDRSEMLLYIRRKSFLEIGNLSHTDS